MTAMVPVRQIKQNKTQMGSEHQPWKENQNLFETLNIP
jgi:hypothetical protein